MVGQGVLRECLRDPQVEIVLLIGRSSAVVTHEKVREIVCSDLTEYSTIENQLTGYDA